LPFNENLSGYNWVWGGLFALFLPQFLILSVSVNPDSLSILLGTLFFYAAYHLMAERLKVFPIFLCVLCAGIGLFTDKSLFFLILLGLILPFFLIRGKKVLRSISFVIFGFFLFVLAASWIAWYFPSQIYSTMSLINVRMLDKIQIVPQLFTWDEFNREFLAYLADSSFLKFGWMAYSADQPFYWVWRISLFLVILGVVMFLGRYFYRRIKKAYQTHLDPTLFRIVLFSLIAVFTQIINVRIYQGTKSILPQGRYLFPLILPIAFIFVLGLKSLFDLLHKKAGQVAVALFVLFQFLFFNYVVWNYLVPVFHLTVKSPHPGL
jgi:4-amino-4-deoxy-L-arabinose transferase-like glycosyltransferase